MISGVVVRRFSLMSRSKVLPTRGAFAEGAGNVSLNYLFRGVLYMKIVLFQNVPFQTKNKARLFVVLAGGAAFAFSLPILGVLFQLKKKQT